MFCRRPAWSWIEALFEQNVKLMADTTKATGIAVRPHVKIHKSVDVAKIQIAHGGIGLTCATIAEAELMSNAGLKNVMWTKQPASSNDIERAVALSIKDPTFMFVIDDPLVFDWVEQAAAADNAQLKVLVSVYAGLSRQGIENGQARPGAGAEGCFFQAHGVRGHHGLRRNRRSYHGFEKRREQSAKGYGRPERRWTYARSPACQLTFSRAGPPAHTTWIMRTASPSSKSDPTYSWTRGISSSAVRTNETTYNDFAGALTVLTTVDSKRHPNQVAIDYGNKAGVRPTDKVKGMPGLEVGTQGAEYGLLNWKDGDHDLKLGDRVEIYCTVLDDSTNYYDRYYVARGEQIVDVWPIMGRSGAAQR